MASTERVQGIDDLQKQLSALGASVGGKALRSAANLAVNPVVKTARTLIPTNDRDYLKKTYRGRRVAPGFAKRSIAKKVVMYQRGRFAKAMVGVKPEAYYATLFVERGTSRQPRQPWLEPALRTNRALVMRRLGQFLKKRIDKASKTR